ncbi:Type 2 DNA topoisomerase 6 subunit B-like [Zea mays]|uniref:Type 2 DNA topoisomerase 6 subunit B-like n=1 Tax=Zea mays TaxID=4577 RepID=A0A1D6GVU8_MAIZE|nr:Type 2 DNA topoisomerase 6 subunit B-like [Zea mays]
MASTSSPHRKLLHSLVYWAVQRCRMSELPCRLTVSLKRPAEPASSPPLRVSVSDTGVGSKLEEFLELDALAREIPVERWDGTLLVTTTVIDDFLPIIQESMMKPFIVIKLIFKKRHQVQDLASWLPHTKIMHDSVELKSAFVSQMMLMLMILYYGWFVSSKRYKC